MPWRQKEATKDTKTRIKDENFVFSVPLCLCVSEAFFVVTRRQRDSVSVQIRTNLAGYRYCSRKIPLSTKLTFAGRSPSRRMKYGNHWLPNGTYTRMR
jgi:hypothetical protein